MDWAMVSAVGDLVVAAAHEMLSDGTVTGRIMLVMR